MSFGNVAGIQPPDARVPEPGLKNVPLLAHAIESAVQKGFTGDPTIAGDGPARGDIEGYTARSALTRPARAGNA